MTSKTFAWAAGTTTIAAVLRQDAATHPGTYIGPLEVTE
jgi:hypothetical protein